jgi:hypothetical protein
METNLTRSSSSLSRKLKWIIGLIIVIVILGAAVLLVKHFFDGRISGISGEFQAVFLTNGQVYFGKLSGEEGWIKLTDIYYLQTSQSQPLQSGSAQSQTTDQSNNIQLIKLGSELHGPQDEMYIEKDKVLFWENMKDDSKVVQAIHQYKSK